MGVPELLEKYDPIRGSDEGSFAGYTIKHRLPRILNHIVEENNFDKAIIEKLIQLKKQIIHGKICDFIKLGSDASLWNSCINPMLEYSWLEVPFYFAEAYFYRLILDKINFFRNDVDPFLIKKKEDLVKNQQRLISILNELHYAKRKISDKKALIKYLLYGSLWGNTADLSQVHRDGNMNENLSEKSTLIDHSDLVLDVFSNESGRVDVILDNCGLELYSDLILAEQLVHNRLVDHVVLHAKKYPTFVSDATESDIQFLIDHLKSHKKESLNLFSERLECLIASNKIEIQDHEFWNSPLHFYQMPEDLIDEFSRSDLIISKGDANYRRIFGDRSIPIDTNPKMLADYLPAKTAALRILKSEILLGLEKEVVTKLKERDNEWLINGKYGIIQLFN